MRCRVNWKISYNTSLQPTPKPLRGFGTLALLGATELWR
jgi:hypothetical protein